MKDVEKIFIVRCTANATVTAHNFDLIKEACLLASSSVSEVETVKEALKISKKDDVFVATAISDVIRLYLSGRKKIFFWVQGILPEESSMRHGKGLRFVILSYLEKLSLKFATHVACVSEAMREHYEKKYNLDLSEKYSVFPCFNTTLNIESFKPELKYKNNVFVYAGGLAVWQCFEKTLDIYKEIENFGITGTKILVLTKDQEQARKLIDERGIENYETGFYPKEELPNILSEAKFGFVIREEHPVNAVATPTKISTYLSCGLIPIFSSCIRSFKLQSEKMRYVVPMEDPSDLEGIKRFMLLPPTTEDVLEEYNELFGRYFSDEKYVKEISGIILKML